MTFDPNVKPPYMVDSQQVAPDFIRQSVLAEAADIVSGERDNTYGAPEDNFLRIAKLWSVIFEKEITASQVASAMIAVKLARQVNRNTYDNWVDIAGYAACGAEAAAK
jgi:hypothetical protein